MKKDAFGKTVLHWAAVEGKSALVKALVAKKVNLDVVGSHGWTALDLAVMRGEVDVVKELIEGWSQDRYQSPRWYTNKCS